MDFLKTAHRFIAAAHNDVQHLVKVQGGEILMSEYLPPIAIVLADAIELLQTAENLATQQVSNKLRVALAYAKTGLDDIEKLLESLADYSGADAAEYLESTADTLLNAIRVLAHVAAHLPDEGIYAKK